MHFYIADNNISTITEVNFLIWIAFISLYLKKVNWNVANIAIKIYSSKIASIACIYYEKISL
jgi:hypothetical protein